MVSSTTIDWASSPLGISIGVLAATYVFFWAYLHLTQDPREPPLAPCNVPIPFLGPMVEMWQRRAKYSSYIKYTKIPNHAPHHRSY